METVLLFSCSYDDIVNFHSNPSFIEGERENKFLSENADVVCVIIDETIYQDYDVPRYKIFFDGCDYRSNIFGSSARNCRYIYEILWKSLFNRYYNVARKIFMNGCGNFFSITNNR